jgi:hypothetical protein
VAKLDASLSDAVLLPLLLERTIIAILILSLTGLSTAWAFDAHAADSVMHEHPAGHSEPDASADGEMQHGCDHYCHAGAHLIGLGYMPHALYEGTGLVTMMASPASILISRSTAPPLRPPQS